MLLEFFDFLEFLGFEFLSELELKLSSKVSSSPMRSMGIFPFRVSERFSVKVSQWLWSWLSSLRWEARTVVARSI